MKEWLQALLVCMILVGGIVLAGCTGESTDSDGDGLSDRDEKERYGTDPNRADSDGDGLSDYDEVIVYGTNGSCADTMGDGLPDGVAVSLGVDPLVEHPVAGYGWQHDVCSEVVSLLVNVSDTDAVRGCVDYVCRLENTSAVFLVDEFFADGDMDEMEEGQIGFLSSLSTVPVESRLVDYDWDDDGLENWVESSRGTGPDDADSDNDGHADGAEVTAGSNPLDASSIPSDTDGDGLPDSFETTYFGHLSFGPDDDPDGDGLSNTDEQDEGTDPDDADTDGDGLSDGDEIISYMTDPLDEDSDDDGLGDGKELMQGTEPDDADSDNDGLSDGAEVNTHGCDPLDGDSDDDGLDDYAEVTQHATDPLHNDTDDDGLDDHYEVSHGFDPVANDTDGDGMMDGYEVAYGLGPLTDDGSEDMDGDLLSNLQEHDNNTAPDDPDTDNDGFEDWDELVVYRSDAVDTVNWVGYFVSNDIMLYIENELDNYTEDIETYYGIETRVYNGSWDKYELKDKIQLEHGQGMVGANLVGNNPIAFYKDSPCDMFYGDLDGDWNDMNNDGSFNDSEISGDLLPEIWIGQMRPPTFNCTKMADLLKQYFDKASERVKGNLTSANKAVVFFDEPAQMNYKGWWERAYPLVEYVDDTTLDTNASNYKYVLEHNTCEFLDIAVHSSPYTHGFVPDDGYVLWHDIRDINISPLFLKTTAACNVADYTEEHCIAAQYVFSEGNCLANIAPSNKGDTPSGYGALYNSVNRNKRLGASILDSWINYPPYHHYRNRLFGTILIGDGLLRT